jgi:hypothetical protein
MLIQPVIDQWVVTSFLFLFDEHSTEQSGHLSTCQSASPLPDVLQQLLSIAETISLS